VHACAKLLDVQCRTPSRAGATISGSSADS
jgi:hypothetical protein